MFRKSAKELHQIYKQGEVSAVEIAENLLARIENHDSQIGAFLTVLSSRFLKKAQELDHKRAEGKPLGKLAGIPIAVKDNIHINKELTTCGSKFLSNYKAPFNATVIELMEREDALIIGKTNLDEFAMGSSTENSAFKHTKNPWDLKCSPGGSSGGSAAAVAARFCPLSLGSDTGGSIRQPAALCGIVGFKPSYGRVSRYGLVAFGSSLDQIGPLATNSQDAALLMEVLGQHCPKDSTSINAPSEHYLKLLDSPIEKKKIGIPLEFLKDLSPESLDNFNKSIEHFKKLGFEIIDIDLNVLKYSIAVYYILATAEASTNLARFDGIRYGVRSSRAKTLDEVYEFSKQEGFGEEVKNRILLGTYVLSSGYKDAYYKKAQQVRRLMIDGFKSAFSTCSLIAMPCSPIPAFSLGAIQDPIQMYLQDIYTIPANLAGLPAISVPSGFSKENKPYGIQLIGPHMSDALVLKCAHLYEKETGYGARIPPLFDCEASI
ncbi:MAG: Asp-tRNA(Asn)/Glu-tRNA(Gln) amidotransferase subunit GatA [Chlamydiota bacterium]